MGKYFKHPVYGHVYGESLRTPPGRLIWPHLVNPRPAPPPQPGQAPGQPRYESSIVWTAGSPDVVAFITTVQSQVNEMLAIFNEGRSAKLGAITKFVEDGNTMDHEKYPYLKDCLMLTARNAVLATSPTDKGLLVVDQNIQIMEDRSALQGGMIVQFVVVPLLTAHGVSFKLEALQLHADDGQRFGGGQRSLKELLDVVGDQYGAQPEAAPAATPTPAPAGPNPGEGQVPSGVGGLPQGFTGLQSPQGEATPPSHPTPAAPGQVVTAADIRKQMAAQMNPQPQVSGQGLQAAVNKL